MGKGGRMRKGRLFLIVSIVFALFFSATTILFAQSVVLTDTEVKEDDSAVKILFATNRTIPVECYDLSTPPQIIVDYMGEIYTSKPEIMMVNKGVVKQMRIVRGTKKSTNLDDSHYAVDFIIIDLKESMRYDFAQGLTNSVLVVSKPGKIVDTKKAEKEVAKLAPKKEPAKAVVAPVSMPVVEKPVAAEPTMSTPSVSKPVSRPTTVAKTPMATEKEYEMPEVKKPQTENRRVRSKRRKTGRVKKQRKRKTMAQKKEADEKTGVGRMRKGIKNLFTFGDGKEGSKEEVAAKDQEPEVQDSNRKVRRKRRRASKPKKEVAKAEDASSERMVRRRRRKRPEAKEEVSKDEDVASERMVRRKRRPKEVKEDQPEEKKSEGLGFFRRRKRGKREDLKQQVEKAKEEPQQEERLVRRRRRSTQAKTKQEPMKEPMQEKRLVRRRRRSAEAEEKKKAPTRRSRRRSRPASQDEAYLNQIEDAKELVAIKKDALKKAEKDLNNAATEIGKVNEAKQTINQRIEDNKSKQEMLRNKYNESLKMATYAKSAANSKWMEYSDSKAKLSLYLKNNADSETIRKAEDIYEENKKAMSTAINGAESAKEESDALLEEYNQAVDEGEDLLDEEEYYRQNLGEEKSDYYEAEEEVYARKQEVTNAKRQLEEIEREYKQYKLEKTEDEYKEALFDIDEKMALEAEREARIKEEQRMQMMQSQQQARLEALEKTQPKEEPKQPERRVRRRRRSSKTADRTSMQKPKETTSDQGRGLIRRRKRKVQPKRRPEASVASTAASTTPSPRSQVLASAVELRNSGLEMQRAGDYDSAVKYYKQALISDPKYATVHNDLGILYEQMGLNDKAKLEYLEALKINPQYIRAHSNLALLYEKSGDNNKAYYHWKQRVELGRPDDPWTEKARQRMELLEQQRK